MRQFVVYALLLLGLTGCRAPLEATAPAPSTTAETNVLLEGRRVVIRLASGDRIKKAAQVHIGGEEVTYRDPRYPGRRSIPLAEVRQIVRVRGGGVGLLSGVAVGAVPGLIVFLTGRGVTREAEQEASGNNALVGGILGGSFQYAGVGLGVVGALLGGAIGQAMAPGQYEVLYDAQRTEEAPLQEEREPAVEGDPNRAW